MAANLHGQRSRRTGETAPEDSTDASALGTRLLPACHSIAGILTFRWVQGVHVGSLGTAHLEDGCDGEFKDSGAFSSCGEGNRVGILICRVSLSSVHPGYKKMY